MINRNIAPPFKIPKGFPLQKPEFIQLKGGLPLYYLFNETFPTLKIDFVFRAGKWFEPKPGIAMLCSKMLTEGTTKLSSFEIASQLDQYGTFTQAESGSDYLLFSAYLLRKHAEHVLPVLHELIYSSCFPENETENTKNVQIQNLKVNLSKNSYLAGVYFKNQLFGDAHPYGKITTEEDILSSSNIQLVNFHSNAMLDNFDIIISGMADEHLLRYIESLFGDNGYRKPVEGDVPGNSSFYQAQTKRVSREESLQCSIRMGKAIIDKLHPDYPALEIYNEILGGYFGSRLMQNIREEKGYTYGIHSSLIHLKNASYFIIGTDAKKDVSDAVVQEVYSEMDKLCKVKVEEEELEKVKNYMKGSFLGSISNVFDLADKFKNLHYYDLPIDYYDHYFENIDAVTPEKIMNIAQKYFSERDHHLVIVE